MEPRARCTGSIRVQMEPLLAAHMVRTHVVEHTTRPDIHLVGRTEAEYENGVEATVRFEDGILRHVEVGTCDSHDGGCTLCYQVTGHDEEKTKAAAALVHTSLSAHAAFVQRGV